MWTLKFCHKANFGTLFQNEINTQFTKVNKILCQSGVEVFSCSSCLFPWRGLQTTLARNILNFSHQIENGLARTLAYPSLMFAVGKHRGTNTNSQFVFQKRSANNFCKEIFWILRTRPKVGWQGPFSHICCAVGKQKWNFVKMASRGPC